MGIKRQRELANISQVNLAKAVGVTQGMVSQWENGEFKPRADKLPIIANVLGCTIEDLLKCDGDVKKRETNQKCQ